MLPVALINPEVLRLPPCTLALIETVVPVRLMALTLAPPCILPPVILPVAEINPPVNILPPATLAEEVILNALFNVLVTLPDKLNATVFIVLMLPTLADTTPAVTKLSPCTLPVAEINPLTNTLPPAFMFKPCTFPVAETAVAATSPAVLRLPETVLPVTLRLANTPTPVAVTPVIKLPLPKK